MLGQNKISNVISKGGDSLEIVNIFPTLQGEGPFSGRAAIFIRLGGCNLQCKFCDTEFDDYIVMTISQIIDKILSFTKSYKINMIVITGGEPLRQPIEKLCHILIAHKFKIQIETNGTINRKLPKEVTIICSPKMINGKYHITKELINYVDYFKFLVEATGEYDTIPRLNFSQPVYIQPIDTLNKKLNKKNITHAIDLVMKHNYILSLQTHKILQIP